MHNLRILFDTASDAVSAATSEGSGPSFLSSFAGLIPLLLLVVVFYFFIIRPQNKRDKEQRALRNSLAVGDTVTTNGGIIGKVKFIKDDKITIDSAGQKLIVHRWAIATIDERAEAVDDDDDDE